MFEWKRIGFKLTKSWEVKSPALQTVRDLEVKWRNYGRLKTSAQSWAGISQLRRHLEGCFVASKPPFGTRVPLHSTSTPISQLWNGLRKSPFSVKFPFCCEMISKLQNGCEIRNDLQIAKLTCEMEEGLQKHFAKPREVAKMPSEPCYHASEEESPAHPGITHTKPLTLFLSSFNHQIP